MKTTFKQFIFLFFVLFAIVITGCGKDDEKETTYETVYTGVNGPIDYINDYLSDVNSVGMSIQNNNTVNYTGLKNNHLYLRSVQFDDLYNYREWKTIIEWEDTEITTPEQKIYIGYGEYETSRITQIYPYVVNTNNGNFSAIIRLEQDLTTRPRAMFIFKDNQLVKKRIINNLSLTGIPWYQGGILTCEDNNTCCYSVKGDTIYTTNSAFPISSLPNLLFSSLSNSLSSLSNDIPTSYEESISINGLTITKYNWRENKLIWEMRVISPFNEPSNSKYTSTLLDKSTNIWKYKVNILYYDGTKKEFVFTVNLDDGKITIINNN